MGVNLTPLLEPHIIGLSELGGKTVAVDAFNTIYQFLSSIRQPDGTPLKDAKGRVTSHLSGILYRNVSLVEAGVSPVYVFDGVPSRLKAETLRDRAERRTRAKEEHEEALEVGDMERARTKAMQSSRMTDDIVNTSRDLLTHMGIPVVQAPGEGEAQAAYMAKKSDVWASGSQDLDSLLFGAPRLVRNLTFSGRRKMPGRNQYRTVNIEVIELDDILSRIEVSREQLVDMAIMMGTDYHPGIKGIGPKRALGLIKKHGDAASALDAIDEEIEPLQEIRNIFLEYEATDEYTIKLGRPDRGRITDLLVEDMGFSNSRLSSALDRMESALDERERRSRQRSLDMFG